jgi:lipopolysaccharide export system permease protein
LCNKNFAAEYETQLKEQLSSDSGLSSLIAGRFQKTGNQKAVVFIHEKNRDDNSLHKVFVAQLPDEDHAFDSIINSSLVYAEKGLVEEDESGSQRLILEKGTRYQKDTLSKEFRSVTFNKYYIQIQDQKVEHKRRRLSAISSYDLLKKDTPEYKAEIQWRLSFPIAAIILTFLAVPLSVVNPRQGKFAKLVPALLLFLGYFLMLTAMRSGIEKGMISSTIGLWPIHLSGLFLGFSLLLKERRGGRKLKALLPYSLKNNHADNG